MRMNFEEWSLSCMLGSTGSSCTAAAHGGMSCLPCYTLGKGEVILLIYCITCSLPTQIALSLPKDCAVLITKINK